MRVDRRLEDVFPQATCELRFSTPLQLLVATVLSAQCTDERVNKVTPALFQRYPDAFALAAANIDDVEDLIRSTGLFRSKAKNLVHAAQGLVERFGGEVPADIEALVSLPGVGRKTALVVAGNAFGVPGLAVDTHVGRVSRRLGLSLSKDPVKVERDLCAQIPSERWTQCSHRFILFGRRVCHSRRPACGACLLSDLCPSFGEGPVEWEDAQGLVVGPEREELLAAARDKEVTGV